MNLSGEELDAVIAVVETGSFRKAALKLHKSQSSISYQIKNLEDRLKLQIFDRSEKQIKLTDVGQVIYNKSLIVSKINSEIFEFSKLVSDGVETKLSLVIPAVTPTQYLTEIIRDFSCRFPQTQIEIAFKTFEEPIKFLLEGSADMVISYGKHDDAEIEKIKWNIIEFIPVTSPDYPAACDALTEEDLNAMPQLVVGGRSTLLKKSTKEIVDNSSVWTITDFLVKRELLINALGWGYMPKMLVERELQEGILIKVPRKSILLKQLNLVRKKSQFNGPALRYLWKLFLDNAGRHVVSMGNQEWQELTKVI